MSVVDELVTLLGLDIAPGAEANATSYERVIDRVRKTAVMVGAALAAAASAVQAYAMEQAKAIEQESRFAEGMDVSYQRTQALGYAANILGGSSQELAQDLANLTKTMNSPIPGEYNQTLYMLGISARDASGQVRKADDLLLAIADRLAGMSKQRQMQFADRLGLSSGTLTVLRNGRAEVERLAQEAQLLGLVLDENATARATTFGRAYRRLTEIVRGLGRAVSVGLLPGLTQGADALANWIVLNHKWIGSGVQQVVEGVALGFQMVGRFIAWAASALGDLLGPLEMSGRQLDATRAIAVATALALVALGVSAVAATWPFWLTAAAVAGLVLVLEDLYVFFTGGKSVIGDWVREFREAYPAIAELIDMVGELAKWLGPRLGQALKAAIGWVWSVLVGLNNFIVNMTKGVASLVDSFLKLVGITGTTDAAMQSPATFNDVPVHSEILARRAGASGGGNTVNIEVNGAGDPAAVGAEVAGRAGLSTQMSAPGMLGPLGAN